MAFFSRLLGGITLWGWGTETHKRCGGGGGGGGVIWKKVYLMHSKGILTL